MLIIVLVYYLCPGKDLKKTYGEWAMVTGATDGIGLGILPLNECFMDRIC